MRPLHSGVSSGNSERTAGRTKVLIMGAAGRDFHNFNMVYRDNPAFDVKAFTAAQVPFIDRRIFPAELAGNLYPEGIPIYPEEKLAALISRHGIEQVVFAYSDVSHEQVMHRASLCLALGADFLLLGPGSTMLESNRPVVSVCAVRTGSGKSSIVRYVVRLLCEKGMRTVAIRHPMAYRDLGHGRVQRFEQVEDLDLLGVTIEEREEFEPLLRAGAVVFSGIDYGLILRRAEQEADIIVWDGGNNDLPFVRPELEIVVVDPLRPGHELLYHPGEANLRRADIVVINKTDTAEAEAVIEVEKNILAVNPHAVVVMCESRLYVETPEEIQGRRVLIVEDGPTLTHGGMPWGAGMVAARRYGAAEIVDPRPFARGSIRQTFASYPHIGPVLPATGYSAPQIEELGSTINAVPCDVVVVASPVDLARLLSIDRPVVRVRYEAAEADGDDLRGCIEGFVDSHGATHS